MSIVMPVKSDGSYPEYIQVGCKCYVKVEGENPVSQCPTNSWDDVLDTFSDCYECQEGKFCSVLYEPTCIRPALYVTATGNGPSGTNETVSWLDKTWTPEEDGVAKKVCGSYYYSESSIPVGCFEDMDFFDGHGEQWNFGDRLHLRKFFVSLDCYLKTTHYYTYNGNPYSWVSIFDYSRKRAYHRFQVNGIVHRSIHNYWQNHWTGSVTNTHEQHHPQGMGGWIRSEPWATANNFRLGDLFFTSLGTPPGVVFSWARDECWDNMNMVRGIRVKDPNDPSDPPAPLQTASGSYRLPLNKGNNINSYPKVIAIPQSRYLRSPCYQRVSLSDQEPNSNWDIVTSTYSNPCTCVETEAGINPDSSSSSNISSSSSSSEGFDCAEGCERTVDLMQGIDCDDCISNLGIYGSGFWESLCEETCTETAYFCYKDGNVFKCGFCCVSPESSSSSSISSSSSSISSSGSGISSSGSGISSSSSEDGGRFI